MEEELKKGKDSGEEISSSSDSGKISISYNSEGISISSNSDKKSVFSLIIGMCVSLLFGALTVLFVPIDNTFYCDKTELQSTLKKVIIYGGNLEDVKHVYNTRLLKKNRLYNQIVKKRDMTFYYREDVPLSIVLSDLKTNYYIEQDKRRAEIEEINYVNTKKRDSLNNFIDNEKKTDSIYLSLLNKIIAENNKKYPFDKLEENQKYSFINIQEKSDSNYAKISSDIMKITDELDNKNKLVKEYLDKSTLSFYISIGALIITILLSIFQIYQNYRSSNIIKSMNNNVSNKISQKNETTKDENIETWNEITLLS